MNIDEIIKSSVPISPVKKAVLNILITQTRIAERVSSVFKSYDISTEQFNVLRILRGQKGNPVNMNLIQDRMIAKTSNTTRLVDKLLAKKLVTRKICPNNRRKVEVEITPSGLELLAKLDPEIDSMEESFGKNITSEELIQLNRLLDKFRNT